MKSEKTSESVNDVTNGKFNPVKDRDKELDSILDVTEVDNYFLKKIAAGNYPTEENQDDWTVEILGKYIGTVISWWLTRAERMPGYSKFENKGGSSGPADALIQSARVVVEKQPHLKKDTTMEILRGKAVQIFEDLKNDNELSRRDHDLADTQLDKITYYMR
jgi:hypothetical protein